MSRFLSTMTRLVLFLLPQAGPGCAPSVAQVGSSGVLVEIGIAWCTCGLFPRQSVFRVALNVETGEHLASGRIGVSAQGYFERRAGRLYVPAARAPIGLFSATLRRRGKSFANDASALHEEFPCSMIGAKDVRIAGGDDVVAVLNADSAGKLWTTRVNDRAWGLSIENGRLCVNTDTAALIALRPRRQFHERLLPKLRSIFLGLTRRVWIPPSWYGGCSQIRHSAEGGVSF